MHQISRDRRRAGMQLMESSVIVGFPSLDSARTHYPHERMIFQGYCNRIEMAGKMGNEGNFQTPWEETIYTDRLWGLTETAQGVNSEPRL